MFLQQFPVNPVRSSVQYCTVLYINERAQWEGTPPVDDTPTPRASTVFATVSSCDLERDNLTDKCEADLCETTDNIR